MTQQVTWSKKCLARPVHTQISPEQSVDEEILGYVERVHSRFQKQRNVVTIVVSEYNQYLKLEQGPYWNIYRRYQV